MHEYQKIMFRYKKKDFGNIDKVWKRDREVIFPLFDFLNIGNLNIKSVFQFILHTQNRQMLS